MADELAARLHRVTDATVWADEFMRLVFGTNARIDKELLTTWFANAIETGATAERALTITKLEDVLKKWTP